MRIVTHHRNNPKLKYSTVLKVQRLERRIAKLIAADEIEYNTRARPRSLSEGRLTAVGLLDQRTKEYKAQKARAAGPPLAVLSPPAPMLPEIGGWPVARLPAGE